MAEEFALDMKEVEYVNNVTHELRQEEGILYPLAGQSANLNGKSEARIETRFSRLKMQKKTTRNGDTNLTDGNVLNRFIKKPGSSNVATLIDLDDIDTISTELKSPLVVETASAARTYHDDQFLVGWWGDAWVGGDTSQTTVPFPAANKVAHNFGGVSVGLTLAKLIELKRLLRKANVNFKKEAPIILLDADAESDLFQIDKYVSFDYQGSKPLVDGELKPWMGFRFLPANLGDSEAYPEAASLFQVGGINRLPVIVPSGIYRGVWTEFWGKVDPRPDKEYSEQIFARAESAVTRTDEKKAWFIETKPVA